MTAHGVRVLARRLLGTAVLVAAMIGLPVLIAATGGAPPSHLPGVHQVTRALTHPISDHAVLRSLAIVGWVLWALFVVAVTAELVAHLRHRPSPAVTRTGFRVPGLQGLAAALVLSTVLAGPARSGHAMTAAPPATLLSVPTPPGASPPAAPPITTAVSAPAGATPSAAGVPAGYVPYTVVRYDSPWAIAEAHLGNGLRWTQILDDQGRSLVDGQEVVEAPWGPTLEDTAVTIYPGQVLFLPPTGAGPAPPPPAPPPAPPAPPPEPAPPSTVWTGTLPPVASPSSNPEVALATAIAPAPAGPVVPARDLVLGGALVASAGVNVLALRRARQAGGARQGQQVPMPVGPPARAERRMRGAADPGPVQVAHQAMAALEEDLDRAALPMPLVTGVVATADCVEVVIETPAVAPDAWSADGTGRRWRRPVTSLSGSTGSAPELHPGLVPVGQHVGSGAHVLLNLEASPVTALTGDDVQTTALVQGVALALAGLPWCRGADVVLVGFGHVLARCHTHVRAVDSVWAVADELRARAVAGASDGPDTAARIRRGDEGLAPTFVLARQPDPTELGLLRQVCRADTRVRAVVAGDADVPGGLVLGPGGFHLPWLAGPVTPTGLASSDVADLDDLLRLALAAPVPTPPGGAGAQPADLAAEELPAGEPPVVVQVLGTIEVEGLVSDFRRPQAREVLVYLAMHGSGVAEHQIDGAIWPERPTVKPTTRDPVISAARSAVGGPARLPFAQGQGPDKRYRTTAEVGTDWERFQRLHHRGRAQRAVRPLVAALRLVRGRPFADVLAGPGYGWLHLEGHLHHIEAEIVDAAELAADLLLEAGDPRRARWAANQGLTASPYSERLWTRLMAVADALGEAQQIERILADMNRRLDLGGDFSQLHPDTLAAYRRYSRRWRAPAGPSYPG